MAHNARIFKDRAVEYPGRYTTDQGEQITLTRDPGGVYEEGTPVNAALMNPIERGLYAAKETVVSVTPPGVGDNQSAGFVEGDRWIVPGIMARNMIGPDWADETAWDMEQEGTSSVTGSTVGGIQQLFFSAGGSSGQTGSTEIRREIAAAPAAGNTIFLAFSYKYPTFPLYSGGIFDSNSKEVRVLDASGNRLLSLDGYIFSTFNRNASGAFKVFADSFTVPENVQYPLSISVRNTASGALNQATTLTLGGLMLLNLTDAFGAGNEPTTEDAAQLFAAPLQNGLNGVNIVAPFDAERYAPAYDMQNPIRSFVCGYSDDVAANWLETPLMQTPKSSELVAAPGFTLNNAEGYKNRFFRFGPFVYFEISLNVTTATTAGTLKNMLAGLPTPSTPVKVPLKSTNPSGASIAAANHFMIFDPIIDPTNAVLQSITAVTVNTIVSASGFYLAADMGNT